MKVENIIIACQKEPSENMNRLLKIIHEKKISLKIVSAGDTILLENQVTLSVLWPDKNNLIEENAMNNNSLVCKLNYQDVSVLLTGDIETIAEETMLQRFQGEESLLQATILKVAHHGSQSSTSFRWLEQVKPEIALIGVGEKNSFGHPNLEVLERLNQQGVRVYRTDQNGEIILKIQKEILVITKLK